MIDSHCHIHHHRYELDRPLVLERASDIGVHSCMCIGCDVEDSKRALNLAETGPNYYATVGVHPHEAKDVASHWLEDLEYLSQNPKVLAIGELGLDFYYKHSDKTSQTSVFEGQLDLAIRKELPVVVHSRDSERETLEILKRKDPPKKGQVHCFTGSMDCAKALVDEGWALGFTGIVTFKNAEALRDVVRMVPLEQILLETDSPYLAPLPYRGKRNEPSFLPAIAQVIADLKQVSTETLCTATTENFTRIFLSSRGSA